MNNTRIEWCDATWNPVTGCLHGCEYCYARKRAMRIAGHWNGETNVVPIGDYGSCVAAHDHLTYKLTSGKHIRAPFPFGFKPTVYHYRLDEPRRVKTPQRIFVCSMADLFGDWVPDEWIQQVFEACEAAPRHTYLFLTKNPRRYQRLYEEKAFPYHKNYWFGSTVTRQDDEYHWFRKTPYHSFLSIEPILEPLGDTDTDYMPEWVIVGAETGNRKGKVIPERWWIEQIAETCEYAGVPLFMKNSLAPIWGEPLIQQWPEALKPRAAPGTKDGDAG